MVRKPLTLFVLLATTGNRFFKAVAHRHQTTSLVEISSKSRVHGSATQILGDVAAAVCAVPVTSVFCGRLLGQTSAASQDLTSMEIAVEVCLSFVLTLVSAWLFKYAGRRWKEGALCSAQPAKGACSAKNSPQNGLTSSIHRKLFHWLTQPWRLGRRCLQRRRLYIHKAVTCFDGIVPWLCGSQSPLASRVPRACKPGSHGMHDWHEALPAGFLIPLEVAACRSPPEVSAALQRLLADRWWEMEDGVPLLESVPEDECLVVNEVPLENLLEQLGA